MSSECVASVASGSVIVLITTFGILGVIFGDAEIRGLSIGCLAGVVVMFGAFLLGRAVYRFKKDPKSLDDVEHLGSV
jgi:hypothetical protein